MNLCFTRKRIQLILKYIAKIYKLYYNILCSMKLQQLKNKQFCINLPSQILRAKNWSKGDIIKVEINKEGDIVLKK
jgi:hypothetical protein